MDNSLKRGTDVPLIEMGTTTHADVVKATYMNYFIKITLFRGLIAAVLCAIVSPTVFVEAKYTPGRVRDRGVLTGLEGASSKDPVEVELKWKPVLPRLSFPFVRRVPDPIFEYLPRAGPAPMRFSDEVGISSAAPSPALPEFSLLSIDYDPYLIETPLTKEDRMDNSVYADVVIDLQPVTIVSGEIEYDRGDAIEDVSNVTIEEERAQVVRAEDVLIFFESKSSSGKTRALIPFSPAQPTKTAPIKSSATYKQTN